MESVQYLILVEQLQADHLAWVPISSSAMGKEWWNPDLWRVLFIKPKGLVWYLPSGRAQGWILNPGWMGPLQSFWCVSIVCSHTPTSRKALFSRQLLPFPRDLTYRTEGAKIALLHFTLAPAPCLSTVKFSFMWQLFKHVKPLVLPQSSFLQTKHCHTLLGTSSPALLLIFLWTQREFSSGGPRTSSGPNPQTDIRFPSIPDFWWVCVLVYLCGCTQQPCVLPWSSKCSWLLATWSTHDINHCVCPLPAKHTALDRRKCSISPLQVCYFSISLVLHRMPWHWLLGLAWRVS